MASFWRRADKAGSMECRCGIYRKTKQDVHGPCPKKGRRTTLVWLSHLIITNWRVIWAMERSVCGIQFQQNRFPLFLIRLPPGTFGSVQMEKKLSPPLTTTWCG